METPFDRMQNMLVEAKRRSDTFNGPCETCRWRQARVAGAAKCTHPIVIAQGATIDDAAHRRYLQDCDEQRDKTSFWGDPLCRPEGLLWEERRSWWSRMWSTY